MFGEKEKTIKLNQKKKKRIIKKKENTREIIIK